MHLNNNTGKDEAFKMFFSSLKKIEASGFQFDQAYRNSSVSYILQAHIIIHSLICIKFEDAFSFSPTVISTYNYIDQVNFV